MTTKLQPANIDPSLDYSVHKLTVSGVDVLGYAQSAFLQANTVYNTANTLSPTDSWARLQANSAYNTANTAYGWGNHASAGYATTTYVGTQISNLVNSAPSTLDTLNELALALGSDANFSTTITNMLGTTGSYANAAFAAANNAGSSAAVVASFLQANAAFIQANAAFAQANTGAIANTFVQVGYPMTMGLVTDAHTGGLGQEQFLRTWDNRTTLPTHLIFANNTIQLDAGYLT